MNNISRLRDSADLLFKLGHLDEAYGIYDEVSNLIWNSLGSVNTALNEFSQKHLSFDFRTSLNFKNNFLNDVANTTFIRSFNLDSDQTLNEFIFTTFGKIQCYCVPDSTIKISAFDYSNVMNEFFLLHNLILNATEEKWITGVFRFAVPILENNSLKKIRYILPEENLMFNLISTTETLSKTDWAQLNFLLMVYLEKSEKIDIDLYRALINLNRQSNNSGNKKSGRKNNSRSGFNGSQNGSNNSQNHNQRNFRSENSKQKDQKRSEDFDLSNSTDEEKQRHFGKVLGLKGKVTRSDIRKKYLETISLYHPDKVQNLGLELIELAEKKTKEINLAYEYFKVKFDL